MQEYSATLVNWNVVSGDRIEAEIHGDKRGRFKDGKIVRTSKIISIDFANHIVRTQNTVYKLGKKYSNIYEDIRALKLLRALNDVQEYCKNCDCNNDDKKAILDFIEWKYRDKTKN